MRQKQKPSWWIFYLIWGCMTALLVWDYWTPWQSGWQTACAILIILGAYSLIALWLCANRRTLRDADVVKAQRVKLPARDVPMSPVQAHYLNALEHYSRR